MGYSPWGCKELDTTERLAVSLSVVAMQTLFERMALMEQIWAGTAQN